LAGFIVGVANIVYFIVTRTVIFDFKAKELPVLALKAVV
jgi:hypothetical protein